MTVYDRYFPVYYKNAIEYLKANSGVFPEDEFTLIETITGIKRACFPTKEHYKAYRDAYIDANNKNLAVAIKHHPNWYNYVKLCPDDAQGCYKLFKEECGLDYLKYLA
jgi:hypothetical protein